MSTTKSVFKAAGLMMVAIFLSRLLGLVREMVIANRFGQGSAVSAYTVAFNLPDLLYFFLSSGALSGAFIPVFTEHFSTGRKKEAWEIFSIIFCLMSLLMGAVIVLSEIFTDPLVRTVAATGFAHNNPELIPLIVHLTRIILPCQFFFMIGGLMMGTLQSRGEFRASAAAPSLYNLGIIFGAVVLSRWFGVAGMAWGTLIGSFLGNIVFAGYWMYKLGFDFKASLNIRNPGVVKVGMLALPVILGLSLPQIDVIVNKWFAAFVSDAAPAALNYANRLMQVPLGMFAQAAGTAILPSLASLYAKGAMDEMRKNISLGFRALLAVNIPASIFMVIMADRIVRTVYMGGKFTSADVPATSIALALYSAGIFAWAGQAIIARAFFAMQNSVTPVVLGSVVTVMFIPFNYIFMRLMGHGGLALATTIAATVHLIGLMWFLRPKLKGIDGRRIAVSTAKICMATLLLAITCWGSLQLTDKYMGTIALRPADLSDRAAFASKIREHNDPVSEFIYDSIPEDKRTYLDAGTERGLKIVLSSINDTLAKEPLYTPERFLGIVLDERVERSAQNITSGAGLLGVNRKLLEVAYPDIVTAHGNMPADTKKGSFVVVMIAFTLGIAAYIGGLKLFRVEEAAFVVSMFRRRAKKKTDDGCQEKNEEQV